jgi:hypothetical protein
MEYVTYATPSLVKVTSKSLAHNVWLIDFVMLVKWQSSTWNIIQICMNSEYGSKKH